jgi:O-antigen ligase
LGLGPANYYQYTSMFSIMGYDVNFNSHNQYIDLLAQVGIFGTVVFLWLMAACAKAAWSIRNRASVGFNRAYAYCSIAAIVGMLWAGLHGDWVFPFVYNVGIDGFRASMLAWLFLGGLIAIEQITLKQTPGKVA